MQRTTAVSRPAWANAISGTEVSAPGKLFGDLRSLLAAVPDRTVVLDLPLLTGF